MRCARVIYVPATDDVTAPSFANRESAGPGLWPERRRTMCTGLLALGLILRHPRSACEPPSNKVPTPALLQPVTFRWSICTTRTGHKHIFIGLTVELPKQVRERASPLDSRWRKATFDAFH
ncbi:hypothetical protein CC78DRAFT_582682 [Lojkania enalia]|uniref:Uncharacterized protein n=1 Tax=Lojkania enalia TaxID=147567 RepID=A0A9P4K5D2_9PLEO|nr:hypothetical protein CC78DRAFT_582682 [Didymosphaeria enalia]